jgi:deazaflavin-dependent oxidoreductase (nitroreductase family)
MRMQGIFARVLGGLLLALVGILVVFVLGMRARSVSVRNGVRKLSRATKRYPLKSAGTAGAYASVVRHVGRRSGREYQTPIHAVPTQDGFVVALPYGSDVDWVNNVVAQPFAVIVHDGQAYQVDRAELVPLAAVEEHFTHADRWAHRLFRVEQALHVRRVPGDGPPQPLPAATREAPR